jgi:hypothetical protein
MLSPGQDTELKKGAVLSFGQQLGFKFLSPEDFNTPQQELSIRMVKRSGAAWG